MPKRGRPKKGINLVSTRGNISKKRRPPLGQDQMARLLQAKEREFERMRSIFLRLSRRRNSLTEEERRELTVASKELPLLRQQAELLGLLVQFRGFTGSITSSPKKVSEGLLRQLGGSEVKRAVRKEIEGIRRELAAIPDDIWSSLKIEKPELN